MAEFKLIQETVHKLAVEKGWHNADLSLTERILLVTAELVGAARCIRNDEPAVFQVGQSDNPVIGENKIIKIYPGAAQWKDSVKPEGTLVELADAVIRIMDICQSQGWDIEAAIRTKHKYNCTRTFRQGNGIL